MRKLLVIGAAFMVAFVLSTVAAARGPANEFAAGSAKSDVTLTFGDEHASFSAHNVPGPPGSCDATGHIVYKGDVYDFTAKINELTVVGNMATFGGPVTKVTLSGGLLEVGDEVFFHASDSGMPGGTGDTFRFFGFASGGVPGTFCLAPAPGNLITQGNIVIKNVLP